MKATFIHNSNGWGYETRDGFFGYFESLSDAQRDASYNGYDI